MTEETPSFDTDEPLTAAAGANTGTDSHTVEDHAPDVEERNWAMLCHLSTFAGYLFPLANILAPLVVWAIKREGHPLVDDQGKEALNFQISITLYVLIALAFSLILIGIPFLLGLLIADLVLTLVAAVKAADGELYRYPATLRLIR